MALGRFTGFPLGVRGFKAAMRDLLLVSQPAVLISYYVEELNLLNQTILRAKPKLTSVGFRNWLTPLLYVVYGTTLRTGKQMIINRLARGTGCGIEPLSQTLRVSPVGPLGKPVQVYQSLSI